MLLRGFLGLVCAAAFAVAPAYAQSPFQFSDVPDQSGPALIAADQMTYASDGETITAIGDVTIVQGARALSADQVRYEVAADRIIATGSVTLIEPGGETLHADRVELTNQLKRAIADQLRIRLSDGSRLVGSTADRISGDRTILANAAFTSCKACEKDSDRAPLWRLRARTVEHDEVAKDLTYEDVTLDIAGIPVFYTPYFSHPDPTVKRRTGFLAPDLFFGGEFDAVAQVPYYWSIAPDKDLTFKPLITPKTAPVAAAEYRQLFHNGVINVDASFGVLERITNSGAKKNDAVRGHGFLDGQFALDDNWRLTLAGAIASDDSYLETFNIDDADTLRSTVNMEGFYGASYVVVGGFAAQDLRENSAQSTTPTVLPSVRGSYIGEQGRLGYAYAEGDARALTRSTGTDSQSASANVGWRAPFTTPGGQQIEVTANLRGDIYNVADANGVTGQDEFIARAHPTATADWRFPLIQQHKWGFIVVEPRVQAVAGLDDARTRNIPNEDAQAVEFDESNFYARDRFPGRDLIDDGQRLDYGVRMTGLLFGGGRAEAFVGQSLAREPGSFAAATDMTGRSSDIVAAATVSPAVYLDLNWRARFAKNDFDIRRQEVSIGAGPDWLRFNAEYIRVDNVNQGPQFIAAREQIRGGFKLKFADNWSVSGSHHRDLDSNEPLLWSASVAYKDECFAVDLAFASDFASQADGGGRDDSVFLRVRFKHLGGIQTAQGVGGRNGERN